jgi:hypothetical protein
VGADNIAKILDRFLVSDKLIEFPIQVIQWVGSGGESDHSPILLEAVEEKKKPTDPFNFNSSWLKEESFIDLVKQNWDPYDPRLGKVTKVQFATNLKKVKSATIT